MIVLPKQWNYWCKKAGLKSYGRRCSWKALSLKGHGRNWRITASNLFEISEPFETFDRWANSGGNTVQIPQSEKEFLKAVEFLLKNPERPS